MWSCKPDPLAADIVQMREDGRDSPATAFLTRRLGAPRTRVEMREDELVHCVVARVGFEQGVANLGKRRVGLECHGSSANLLYRFAKRNFALLFPNSQNGTKKLLTGVTHMV